MNDKDIQQTREPLKVVACKIEEHAKKSDDHVIAAAKLLQDVHKRVEMGEAGDISWLEWVRKNINLSKSRIYELYQIAKAENPEAEIRRLRELTYKRVKQHRAKKAAAKRELERERQELINWAREASIDQVRDAFSLIKSKIGDASPDPNDQSGDANRLQAA